MTHARGRRRRRTRNTRGIAATGRRRLATRTRSHSTTPTRPGGTTTGCPHRSPHRRRLGRRRGRRGRRRIRRTRRTRRPRRVRKRHRHRRHCRTHTQRNRQCADPTDISRVAASHGFRRRHGTTVELDGAHPSLRGAAMTGVRLSGISSAHLQDPLMDRRKRPRAALPVFLPANTMSTESRTGVGLA